MKNLGLEKFLDEYGDIDLLKFSENYRGNFSKYDMIDILNQRKDCFLGFWMGTSLHLADSEYLKLLGGMMAMNGVLNLCQELGNCYEKRKFEAVRCILKTSDEYLECKELYLCYLKSLSQLFKSIDVKDALETSILYSGLLGKGYFSVTGKSEFKNYKHDTDYLAKDLYGSRVITGTSVCRHNAVMLTDLLNEMGFSACNLLCYLYFRLPRNLKKFPFRYNHLITGIVDENGKYVFDPTNNSAIARFQVEEAQKYGINPENFAFFLEYFGEGGYRIDLREEPFRRFNERYPEKMELFQKAKFNGIIQDTNFKMADDNLASKILNSVKSINDFYFEQGPTMKRINVLNKKLFPCSDYKITSWKVR